VKWKLTWGIYLQQARYYAAAGWHVSVRRHRSRAFRCVFL
jgi:hypothetical protein